MGEVGQALTETAEELKGSGVEDRPGGAAADGGDTWEVTSEDTDTAGAGGCRGAEKMGRERVSGRRENPAGEAYGVGIREGGTEASRVAENPGGYRQGVGRGVEFPRDMNTPGVE